MFYNNLRVPKLSSIELSFVWQCSHVWMRSDCSSRCTLLAEIDERIGSDSLSCLHPKIVMLRLLTTPTYSWCGHSSHRSLCPVLQINTNFIVLDVSIRQRGLQLYHWLWAPSCHIPSRMIGVVLGLVSKVRAVLCAAQWLWTILLRILINLRQWSVLKEVDTVSLADHSSELVVVACRCDPSKQSLRERNHIWGWFIFHIYRISWEQLLL